MMNGKIASSVLAAALTCLLVPGCLSPGPDAAFYQLQPSRDMTALTDAVRGVGEGVILVGPIEVGDYLARPQMVWRKSPHEIRYDEMNRWAEPLRLSIASVVGANLSALLHPQHVTVFPVGLGLPARLRVVATVERFEGIPHGRALLVAHWSVQNEESGDLVHAATTRLETDVAGENITDVVAAQSALLAQWSELIVEAVGKR